MKKKDKTKSEISEKIEKFYDKNKELLREVSCLQISLERREFLA